MARPNVPKFGNWENEKHVHYTIVFSNARKNKGGKMINPNDPQQNPDMFPNMDPPPPSKPKTKLEEQIARGAATRPTPDHKVRRENGNFRQFSNSPARTENVGRIAANESTRSSHYQAKVSGRGYGSPAREGKNSFDSSHGTYAKSRLMPLVPRDESPERGAEVPVFGTWNDKDPQSGDNYTQRFNEVRKRRNNVPGNVSATPKHLSCNAPKQQFNMNQKQKCCFPWL